MEKEKVRMPAGALIASILIVLFLLAAVAGVVSLAVKSNSGRSADNGVIATDIPTQEPSATDAPTQTDNPPAGTQDPGRPGPSSALDHTGDDFNIDGLTQEDIIAKCMDAVVSIDIKMPSGSTDVYAGSGSGVIFTEDGYIVTCNHVIEGSSAISVYLNDGTEYDAELIGADSVTDIAVIKISGSGFPHATLGNSSELRVGNRVYAIGNALGELSNTVTDGIISGLDREIEIEKQSMVVLQTSASINSGNSGGALFLYNGELIGIVNAKSSGFTSSGATIEGLAFAVPIDTAKPIIADLMDYGFVTGRPFLGVSTTDSNYSTGWFNYVSYPVVASVVEGSSADIAGIQVNDIITKIDGKDINSSVALRAMINTYNIGDTITVTVMRGNNTVDLQVTLLERTSK